ncbi:hypothetical protein EAL2_c16600 [Peptoclostridium acidaminophilum DSM 3953]|uniref:TadE-like domain-containing protein n=1 Tax=Peptoclostridium acidaminophilum DSM 3953 TaxID=1286171 RepID=W8T7S7_PEPAC|nr:TadE family protein [Peptoclostridium acidaminophilum]AHM56955.1 hypothetical protein EAL2_c16600 [Peptoclostridium acidaminophilum DSM 3953]
MLFFKRVKNRKGQALVELALSVLIMLGIMLGIAEFGWLFKSYIVVTNASREAARRAAVDTDYGGIQTDIAAKYPPVTVVITPGGGNVTAVASQDYEMITPVGDLLELGLGDSINIVITTVMKSET